MHIIRLCLLIYLVLLCKVLFFNVGSTDRSSYYARHATEREIHLVPFRNTCKAIKTVFFDQFEHDQLFYYRLNVVKNLVGNLFLFLPWGLLGPLAFKKFKTISSIILSTFLISLSAELLQFKMELGVFDIDDIIFNTLGAIAGFYLLRLGIYLFSILMKRMKP